MLFEADENDSMIKLWSTLFPMNRESENVFIPILPWKEPSIREQQWLSGERLETVKYEQIGASLRRYSAERTVKILTQAKTKFKYEKTKTFNL